MKIKCKNRVKLLFLMSLILLPLKAMAASDVNFEKNIAKWLQTFQPSTLTKEEQVAELKWFNQASTPLRGIKIKSVAERINTHIWERDVLAKAFKDITGIHVEHEIVLEGDVVRRLTEQMMTGRTVHHIYVNDADLIGTHLRLNRIVDIGKYIKSEGESYTNPGLDLDDFLNLECGQDYDGRQLQLPDQQFPNLYWFRYDWFRDPKTRDAFKKKYGYDLGVPVNWAAYEDIAAFFTGRKMKNPNGSEVTAFGHLDYGEPSPYLGPRFSDSWLSIAGMGDTGLPNGFPVDEWGIRVENKIPVGSIVERGGALDGPAAVYALTKYLEWMDKYAPLESNQWGVFDLAQAARGDIAQAIFMFTSVLSDEPFHKIGGPMVDRKGRPVWRVAPTPHGRYWDEGMKVGYQDAGSWTIPENVRGKHRAAAWLWAQFCISKTVSVKKILVGMTPVRKSSVSHPYVLKNAYRWGGLIEFYNSPSVKKWTDNGPNVPHYPALSGLWWSYIARATKGELTAQEAMTALARAQDKAMENLKLDKFTPKLNPMKSREYWLNQPGSPKPERKRRMPETTPYDGIFSN